MKASVSLPVLLLTGFLLAPAARAADDNKEALVTGGNCQVKTIRDVAYTDANDPEPDRHKLDIYIPGGKKNFPVLFFVHGGGWRTGDKRGFARAGTLFARNGVGTVIINYRLSPRVKHPAHIQDVARAFAWTYKNIAKYGGDPGQLFVSGHSAGGHLVALLATDPRYLKAEKLALSNIKGVMPLSGVYTIRPLKWLTTVFGSDEEGCKNASPLEHVKGSHPPFLIVYADKDFKSCDLMSEQLCKALKGCKCEAVCLKIEDRDHGSIVRKAAVSADDPLVQAMLKFIAKHSDLKLTVKK